MYFGLEYIKVINLCEYDEMSRLQAKVYHALTRIPVSKVVTYKVLAAYVGCKSAQAIGQILKRNPNAPQVPCHRVVKSDLTIGGYSGEKSGSKVQDKINLLIKEGVVFKDGKVAKACLYAFEDY